MKLKEVLAGIDEHIWSSETALGEFFQKVIKLTDSKHILELGVFKGKTSSYLIDSLPNDGSYTGVDIEDHRCDSVKLFMEENDCMFIKESSLTAVDKLPSKFYDFIFIDSVHELDYLREEFKKCERVIKQNGIIALHDCYIPGVKAWIDYLKKFGWFEVINFDTLDDGYGNQRGVALVKCLCK